MDIRLRNGLDSDAAEIARIGVAGWQAGYVGLVPRDFLDSLDVATRAEVWRHIIASSPSPPLVAESDGEVVGFVSFGPTRDADADPDVTAEVYAIYVDPGRWRAGIGSALLVAAVDRLSLDFTRCTLWALDGNDRADRFYAAHGFLLDGARKVDESRGMTLSEVRYARDLNDN